MRRAARAALAGAFAIAAAAPVALAPQDAGALTAAHGQPAARHPGRPAGTRSGQPAGLPGVHPVPGMPLPAPNCPPQVGRSRLTGEPWAQQALQFSSVWNLASGRGVTVAVVDSGVDYSPQLAGRVSYIDVTGQGPQDCVGHGTAVASIIAASDKRARGIPFYGVAPAARILSVKVNTGENGYASLLARGIRDAAAAGAQVINVSVQTPANSPALRAAVSYALGRDAVVVAAAGNDNPGSNVVGPFYPASYPGVLSVAAVDQTGAVTGYTDTRTAVSVTAPGANVASAWPHGFSPADQGTSFATAFVSGEAALVRSAYPRLTAAQVVSRIEATADGTTGVHTGAGMINPIQAVTAVLPGRTASAAPSPQPVSVPRLPRPDPLTRTVAISVTGGAIAAAFLVAVAAVVVPRGRRRRWQPGRAVIPAAASPATDTESDWGEEAAGPDLLGPWAGPAGAAAPQSLTSAPGSPPGTT